MFQNEEFGEGNSLNSLGLAALQRSTTIVQPSHECFIPFSYFFCLSFSICLLSLCPVALFPLQLLFLLKSKCILHIYISGGRIGRISRIG